MSDRLINLTGHTITIYDEVGNQLTIPPEGDRLGVDSRQKEIGFVAKFPIQVPIIIINRQINQDDLPPKIPGTAYIVSMVTAMAYPERTEFLVPGEKVRDEHGRIIGCKNFRMII